LRIVAPPSGLSLLTDDKARKPRPGPDLPSCFDAVDQKNIFELTSVGQETTTDRRSGEVRGPFRVATHIKVVGKDGEPIKYFLEDLTVDNLCALVKKLSIKGYASQSKLHCWQLIGKHVVYQQAYNLEIRENSAIAIQKKLNSELQKIQAFFHPDIFEQNLQVNSLKSRADHENGTSKKQTWSALADLYNSTDKDPALDNLDDTCIKDYHNHLLVNTGYEDVDLTNFTQTTDKNKLHKFITGLFKLRQEMKALMTTILGTHGSNPMSFVDTAKKCVKASTAHCLALCYFYIKCEEFPCVDDEFASSLPEEMKSSFQAKPPAEIIMSTPSGASVITARSTAKKSSKNDFSDESIQAFRDIAAAMKEKHSTAKMFRLLQMDGVSPNTKKNIHNALLEEFWTNTAASPPAKWQKVVNSATILIANKEPEGPDMDMHYAQCSIVAEDYVIARTSAV
jgi:hypothetical protein